MPDLLVPGTSGCKLELNGNDAGWPTELSVSAWLMGLTSFVPGLAKRLDLDLDADAAVDLLSMEFGDPSDPAPKRTSLANGVMACGAMLRLAYNQFLDFEPFVYDWRSDIRDSAARLVERLSALPEGGARWRILAHSQGGLVVVAASKLYARAHGDDDRAFSRRVSHVALLGTPLHGTVNVVEALLRGDALAPSFRPHLQRIVRTWPAVHQMLPVWPGCVRRRIGAAAEAAPFDLMEEAPWVGQAVSPAMLERARVTRRDFLRAPLSRMNGVKVQILMSRALPTWDHVVLGDAGLELPARTAAGDGLVPEDATFQMSGFVERARMHAFGGGSGTTLQHFVLANDPVIATAIKDFFSH
jgi:hypothetical protein